MSLYRNGAFVADPWRHVAEGEDVSPAGHVILPLDWWLQERAIFAGSNAPVGVRIEPGVALETIADDVPRLALIALSFPKYGDGRAFSLACLLRARYGFRGELRAVGDVLIDQIAMMERCGFDSFEISDANTERALREGRGFRFSGYYQPGLGAETPVGERPWLRRPA